MMAYKKIEEVSKKSEQYLWPYLEVYLFSLVDALKGIEQNSPEVQSILAIYLELARKENFTIPIIIRKTFLRIFRALMTIQQKELSFIKMLFELTAASLPIELTVSTAEKAFEKGCQCNYQLMEGSA